MDAITIATLAGVILIGIERILARFQCSSLCHGFNHVDLSVSRCCRLDIEREQSPPTSPVMSGLPSLERSVEDVIAQIAINRGSTPLSPTTPSFNCEVSPPGQ